MAEYGPLAKALYDEEHHKLELDALNVLYVALTRAEKALYIITEKDLKSNGDPKMDHYSGLFIRFLKEKGSWDGQSTVYPFGNLEPSGATVSVNAQETISFPYTHKDRASFRILAKSGMLWDTEVNDARTRGNLVHSILGLIETEKNKAEAFGSLHRNGDLSMEETTEIEKKIDQIINHDKLRAFYEEGNLILNERDIITSSGAILRPDRIVIREGRASLIDYKTGKKNIAYRDQLLTYAEALQTMGYEIENKIIVYINEIIEPEFI